MKFKTKPEFSPICTRGRTRDGFTLAEVLVAMALIAAVVPTTVQALRLASLAGEVSQRKSMAARVGDRVLNEAIITGQYQMASGGTEQDGPYEFTWKIHDDPWTAAAVSSSVQTQVGINLNGVNSTAIHEVSVDVSFTAQGKKFTEHLSTLVNIHVQATASAPPPMNTVQ